MKIVRYAAKNGETALAQEHGAGMYTKLRGNWFEQLESTDEVVEIGHPLAPITPPATAVPAPTTPPAP